jgi:hypothetical protein
MELVTSQITKQSNDIRAADTPTLSDLPEVILERFGGQRRVTDHPYFVRMRNSPLNTFHLWVLLANLQVSVSRNFVRHLANITSRIDDDRIRCILASQLYDELGCGDYARVHTRLFTVMMSELEPWRPVAQLDASLAPGMAIVPLMEAIYGDRDVYHGLGAIVVGEIVSNDLDQFIAETFRRQTEIELSTLEWVTIHNDIEPQHARAVIELLRFVPEAHRAAVLRGAQALFDLGWAFSDQAYALCYDSAPA